MFLNVGSDIYEFSSFPEFVYEHVQSDNSVVTDRKIYYSNSLPQNISGLGVLGGFFWVVTSKDFDYNNLYELNVSISLHTNRGKLNFPIVCKKELS